MPRPKDSKNKPKTPPSPPNGVGHNSDGESGAQVLQGDAYQALALQGKKAYEDSLALKKKADADFKNTCKRIKADLGPKGVDLIKDMILVATPEGEKELKARAERAQRAARYMATSLGFQFDFFEDRTPVIDRANAEGQRDAMSGAEMTTEYAPGTIEYQAYLTGYHKGGETLRATRESRIGSPEEREALDEIERSGIGPAAANA